MDGYIVVILFIIGFLIILIPFLQFRKKETQREIQARNRRIEEKLQEQKLLETVTQSDRGTWSERQLVLTLLKYGTPSTAIFHDLYVRKYNGDFSQIDLVVATPAGIIVFEVKDYDGWIFGKGNQGQWTQVLAYGKEKYRFYNPIIQNNRHIEELRKQLRQFGNIPFYSVVVFYGDCKLKDVSFIPDGTFLVKPTRILDCIDIIKSKEPVKYADKIAIVNVLRQAVQNGDNEETRTKHIRNIKDMLGKDRIFD